MLRTVFELAILAAVGAASGATEPVVEEEMGEFVVQNLSAVTADGWTLPLYRIVAAKKETDDAATDEAAGDAADGGEAAEGGEEGGDADGEAGEGDGETPPEDVQDGEEGDEDDAGGSGRRLSAPAAPVVSNFTEIFF